MKIAFDLDEIIVPFLPHLVEYYNEKYSTNLQLKDFFSYNFWEVWGGTKEEAIQVVYDFHKTKYFRNIEPFPEMKSIMIELAKDNELYLITSRQKDVERETREMMDEILPGVFKKLYFTNHFSQNGNSLTKSGICNKEEIKLVVEDNFRYALECLTDERKVILLDYPWNKSNESHEGLYRVKSFQGIFQKINELSGQ
jgi:5'(3')-deoxyribonucleotidase